jgi:molybdopterin-guanine dinucleotide biosynthesis protein A
LANQRLFSAILAGGRSRRFGSPKAFEILGGETILARVIRAHRSAGLAPSIVADDAAKFAAYEAPVVVDLVHAAGPLGGLYSALRHVLETGGEGVCVTGCDLPFLEGGMLRAVHDRRDTHDAVVIVESGTPGRRALIAWYAAATLPVVEQAIAEHDLSLHRLIDRLENPLLLPVSDIPLDRPPAVALTNINTREDLRVAIEYLQHHPDS